MKTHGVDYLNFKFSQSKSLLGYCTVDCIAIQENHALIANIDEVKDTILHEIAHALAGNENNHNAYWKSIAEDLGVVLKSNRYKED